MLVRDAVGRNEPATPLRPPGSRRPIGLLAGALVGVSVAFVLLVVCVRGNVGPIPQWDLDVWRLLVVRRPGWLTSGMRAGTVVGSEAVLLAVVLSACAIWRWRRASWTAPILLLTGYVGTAVLVDAVKLLVARARPPWDWALAPSHGFSFPSGHAAEAVAVYGMIATLLSLVRLPRRSTLGLWVLTAAVIIWVASSRLYLGLHWLTDVLAGLLLGTASVLAQLLLVFFLLSLRERDRPG